MGDNCEFLFFFVCKCCLIIEKKRFFQQTKKNDFIPSKKLSKDSPLMLIVEWMACSCCTKDSFQENYKYYLSALCWRLGK
jgi:hypothetical protein